LISGSEGFQRKESDLKSHFFGFLRNRLTAFLDQTETVSFFFYLPFPPYTRSQASGEASGSIIATSQTLKSRSDAELRIS